MPGVISANYRELTPDELQRVTQDLSAAWKDPEIPRRQYELAVKPELDNLRNGKPCAPFAALIKCIRKLPIGVALNRSVRLLDVGASTGYYHEVLTAANFKGQYTALDFSPAFKELAEQLYPGIAFDLGDARALPYWDNAFDIVLSGCCLLHIPEYESVIRETARVASQFAIFSKTPILLTGPTRFYEKEAYGVRTIEIHFSQSELLQLFEKHGLVAYSYEDVSTEHSGDGLLIHRTYLLRKPPRLGPEWESA